MIEILYIKQRIQFKRKEYADAYELADTMISIQEKIIAIPLIQQNPTQLRAEKSELANMLHVKGQVSERCGIPFEEILKIAEKAIEIEEEQCEGIVPSDLLGRLYKVKGGICAYLGRSKDAQKWLTKAVEVFQVT